MDKRVFLVLITLALVPSCQALIEPCRDYIWYRNNTDLIRMNHQLLETCTSLRDLSKVSRIWDVCKPDLLFAVESWIIADEVENQPVVHLVSGPDICGIVSQLDPYIPEKLHTMDIRPEDYVIEGIVCANNLYQSLKQKGLLYDI
jgi:hypothetical protein